ncbi:MAG: hypothetical protein WC222_09145 [Parachlamydiales bacterium]|jgi:Ran GTPase-activating protein (RanGAP) involved in mRNA processing and transport
MSFDATSIQNAIRTGELNGTSFDKLMRNQEFLNSDDLYSVAVAIIHSYSNNTDMPAIKRAYDILENTSVKSLPVNQRGIISYISMWSYNSVKSKSEQIMSTNFSDYLQTIVTTQTTGIDLEKKLVRHDKQVESFLKTLGIPASEWQELKLLIAQRKEGSAIHLWNRIIAEVREQNPGLFSGTKDVEDFLLGHKTVQHLVKPASILQARFIAIFPKIPQAEILPQHLDAWSKIQLSLLKGDDQSFKQLLENSNITHMDDWDNYFMTSSTSDIIESPATTISYTLFNTSKDNVQLAPGRVRPVTLDNSLYFAAATPTNEIESILFFEDASVHNISVIVDLRGEFELPNKFLPSEVGEKLNGIELLEIKHEKIPRPSDAEDSLQEVIRATVKVTSRDGTEKKYQILRLRNWVPNAPPDPEALQYVSREAAKIEKQTKGKLLVTSTKALSRVPAFLIYHHVSESNDLTLRKIYETYDQYTWSVPEKFSHHLDRILKALKINSEEDDFDFELLQDEANTTHSQPLQKNLHLNPFLEGLEPSKQQLCALAVAGLPSPYYLNFLSSNNITYKELENRFREKYPKQEPSIESIMSTLVNSKLFIELFPEQIPKLNTFENMILLPPEQLVKILRAEELPESLIKQLYIHFSHKKTDNDSEKKLLLLELVHSLPEMQKDSKKIDAAAKISTAEECLTRIEAFVSGIQTFTHLTIQGKSVAESLGNAFYTELYPGAFLEMPGTELEVLEDLFDILKDSPVDARNIEPRLKALIRTLNTLHSEENPNKDVQTAHTLVNRMASLKGADIAGKYDRGFAQRIFGEGYTSMNDVIRDINDGKLALPPLPYNEMLTFLQTFGSRIVRFKMLTFMNAVIRDINDGKLTLPPLPYNELLTFLQTFGSRIVRFKMLAFGMENLKCDQYVQLLKCCPGLMHIHVNTPQDKYEAAQVSNLLQEIGKREHLKTLYLNGIIFGPKDVERLFGSPKKELEVLSYISDSLSDEGAAALAKHIPQLTNLIELSLYTSMAPQNAVDIVKGLRNLSRFKTLALARLDLRNHQIEMAQKIGALTNLETLNLRGNVLEDVGVSALAEQLQYLNKLKELHLFNNGIGDSGIQKLAENLQQLPELEILNISDNNISDSGIKQLADKLNPALNILKISDNKISDEGANAIISKLQFVNSLTELDIRNNNLSENVIRNLFNQFLIHPHLSKMSVFPSVFPGTVNETLLKNEFEVKKKEAINKNKVIE